MSGRRGNSLTPKIDVKDYLRSVKEINPLEGDNLKLPSKRSMLITTFANFLNKAASSTGLFDLTYTRSEVEDRQLVGLFNVDTASFHSKMRKLGWIVKVDGDFVSFSLRMFHGWRIIQDMDGVKFIAPSKGWQAKWNVEVSKEGIRVTEKREKSKQ